MLTIIGWTDAQLRTWATYWSVAKLWPAGRWNETVKHKTSTEGEIKVCTWLREISSCSCLTVLPGPAWVLLSKTYKPLFPPLYTYASPCVFNLWMEILRLRAGDYSQKQRSRICCHFQGWIIILHFSFLPSIQFSHHQARQETNWLDKKKQDV